MVDNVKPESEPRRDARAEAGAKTLQARFLTRGGNGVATAVTQTATSVTVTLNLPEPDTGYGVVVTPNWGTTAYVSAKTTSTFTVTFGTAAPASATVDWITFRVR